MTETLGRKVGGTLADLIRKALGESEESASAFLRRAWISSAMRELRDARRQAGLSQEQVAQRLGTTQSAIARLENDPDGKISLYRYINYALACGFLPFDIVLRPASELRAYAVTNAEAPRTQLAFERWLNSSAIGTTYPTENAATTIQPSRSIDEPKSSTGNATIASAYGNTSPMGESGQARSTDFGGGMARQYPPRRQEVAA